MIKIKKIYLASPFFNKEQIERVAFVEDKLRDLGFEVFSPREHGVVDDSTSIQDSTAIFYENMNALNLCDAVFAITDGKDVGTMFEAGYAFALEKPVMYFCETLNGEPFNLMLAKSACYVFTERDQLDLIANVLGGANEKEYEYDGTVF